MTSSTRPSVLFVYFSYTGQTLKVVETMAEVMESRGCDVCLVPIEFHRRSVRGAVRARSDEASLSRGGCHDPSGVEATAGDHLDPEAASTGDYDFVLVGAPTW